MKINIKATNLDLNNTIRTNVNDKLQVIEKFIRPEDVIHVEVAREELKSGEKFRAEVHISPSGYYADAEGADFFEALDSVIPKITVQMRRDKDKRVSLRRRLGNAFKRLRRK